MSIRNTQDPSDIHATALLALATGDTNTIVEEQERAGQRQLVNSDRLPVEIQSGCGDTAAFEALGFTFGEPDRHDPLFRPATLPDGWKREGSDHDMWSFIVDELGRRRVAVFYKAAFYDRRASMRLNALSVYVFDCRQKGVDVVTDDTWATPAAVAEAASAMADTAHKQLEEWQRIADDSGPSSSTERYIAEFTAERDAYLAIAAHHTTA
ncbi:hypothetical protein [Streptomyces sp. NBC_00620]|uniref:hypothetical protein n=1 Tax=Streptomyces sp. NBC_00620 TaxID=2903666 RepID=UPI00224F14E7|nr:hypothetical protein [Streptomyces sp. NBC_00620]MCX4974266.1 hypothetical protein [Streptomyces sp. NBC_00620]